MKSKMISLLALPLLCGCQAGESSFQNLSAYVGSDVPVSTFSALHPLFENDDSLLSEKEAGIKAASALSYEAFAKNLTAFAFQNEAASSANLSIPDAYLDLAIEAKTSSEEVKNALLPMFGLSSQAELDSCVEDLSQGLFNLVGSKENPRGGIVLNSLFVGSGLSIAKNDALLASLRDSYGVSLYHDNPYEKNIDVVNTEKTPVSYGDPILLAEGELGLDDYSKATYAGSSYSYFSQYAPAEIANYRNLNKDSAHRLSFEGRDGAKKEVAYNEEKVAGKLLSGADFQGFTSELGVSLFLPNAGVSAFAVLPEVAAGSYQGSALSYLIKAEIPHFSVQGSADLSSFAGVDRLEGAFSSLVENFASASGRTHQKSLLTYDEKGFAMHSLTFTVGETSSTDPETVMTLNFDRPFVYRNDLTVTCSDDKSVHSLPTFLGYINQL
jgi:hypothetical protein